jgi:formate-dependent nitrite reductase cytochrome c552 subunit
MQHFVSKSTHNFLKIISEYYFSDMKKWTDAQLVDAVINNKSINGILREIGLKINGSSHKKIKNKIKELNLDTSHFTGKGWCQGNQHKEFVQKYVEYPLNEVLIKNSNYLNAYGLKRKLLKAGTLEDKCYKCGITETWQGEPITLHMHHINGDRTDNRLKNLTILCPNCHSQTPNYASKNIKKRKSAMMTKNMIIRVGSSLLNEFHKHCNNNYKSVSEVIREMMNEYTKVRDQ